MSPDLNVVLYWIVFLIYFRKNPFPFSDCPNFISNIAPFIPNYTYNDDNVDDVDNGDDYDNIDDHSGDNGAKVYDINGARRH